jgi:penicillin-binding protein 1C
MLRKRRQPPLAAVRSRSHQLIPKSLQKRYRGPRRKRLRRLLRVAITCVVFVMVWAWFGPVPSNIRNAARSNQLVFLDRNGKQLEQGAPRPSVRGGRGPSLASRAEKLVAATVIAEDERFFGHIGIDPIALGRAAIADVKARRIVQGGSTLTQQLVKVRMGGGSGLFAKGQQAVYAMRLERELSKDQILSAYLAEAPYGGRIVGAEAAAFRYFNVTVAELSWQEAAYLAALPQRPTRFNPMRDPKAAINRRNWILRRLRDRKTITAQQYQRAIKTPPGVRPSGTAVLAPHLIEYLKQQQGVSKPEVLLPKDAKSKTRFRTTIDSDLQRDIEGIARANRRELRGKNAANVAVVVLDNETGAVRAWEGSGDYFAFDTGGMINGPVIARQTGSTIKPLIYALGFDAGMSPGDLVEDTPLRMSSGSGAFVPLNYDRKFRGIISARTALGSSINVPAVRLLRKVGIAKLVEELQGHGISLDRPASEYGLSLALGAGEMSLLDVTRAYASFARGGRVLQAQFYEPAARQLEGERVVSETAAFLVTDVLADNDARAPSFGRNSVLKFPFPVAAKTGTSQNFRDNWVIGYTKDFTVGVWVGNFDRTALEGATGVSGAGPIFQSVMLAAKDRLTPNRDINQGPNGPGAALLGSVPSSLERRDFCMDVQCDSVTQDWARRGSSNGAPLRGASSSGTPSRGTPSSGASSSGAPSSEAAKPSPQADSLGVDVTPNSGSSRPQLAVGLRLVEPSINSVYVIDSTVPEATQRLPLLATGGRGNVRFTVDGKATERFWALVPGRHIACAIDDADPGKPSCNPFTVRG